MMKQAAEVCRKASRQESFPERQALSRGLQKGQQAGAVYRVASTQQSCIKDRRTGGRAGGRVRICTGQGTGRQGARRYHAAPQWIL